MGSIIFYKRFLRKTRDLLNRVDSGLGRCRCRVPILVFYLPRPQGRVGGCVSLGEKVSLRLRWGRGVEDRTRGGDGTWRTTLRSLLRVGQGQKTPRRPGAWFPRGVVPLLCRLVKKRSDPHAVHPDFLLAQSTQVDRRIW